MFQYLESHMNYKHACMNSRIYIRDGKLVSDAKVSDENPPEYKFRDGNPSENIDWYQFETGK